MTPKERYRAAIEAYYAFLDANDYTSDAALFAYHELVNAEEEFFAWAGIDKMAIGCPRR